MKIYLLPAGGFKKFEYNFKTVLTLSKIRHPQAGSRMKQRIFSNIIPVHNFK